MNNWQNVWNKRKVTSKRGIENFDEEKLVQELKRLDGFDIADLNFNYSSLKKLSEKTLEHLQKYSSEPIKSIFEVGCGSGANLYFYNKAEIEVGGIDYSQTLVDILKTVPAFKNIREILCDEAKNMSIDIKYDSIISDSVFHYFYDLDYAKQVLEKILAKTNKSIGILSVHDKAKEKDFFEFRRKLTPNYDEHYRGLPKLFYDKKFFIDFAEKNNLKIEFTDFDLEEFWNTPFVYNCYMYKN